MTKWKSQTTTWDGKQRVCLPEMLSPHRPPVSRETLGTLLRHRRLPMLSPQILVKTYNTTSLTRKKNVVFFFNFFFLLLFLCLPASVKHNKTTTKATTTKNKVTSLSRSCTTPYLLLRCASSFSQTHRYPIPLPRRLVSSSDWPSSLFSFAVPIPSHSLPSPFPFAAWCSACAAVCPAH